MQHWRVWLRDRLPMLRNSLKRFRDARHILAIKPLTDASDIDVVYIATPHSRHYQDCLLALNAGKPILCEKPFTINRREAQKVFDTARAKNLFCMEAMWMRFLPLMQEVRRIIQRGDLGDIRFLSADFGYPAKFNAESRLFNRELGGGALLDRSCYALSLAVYLLGKPAQIEGFAHLGSTGVDEQCSLLLKYDDGALAQLSATMQTYGTNQAIIAGTRGQITIQPPFYCPESITVHQFPDTRAGSVQTSSSVPNDFKERLKATLKTNPWFKRLRRLLPKGGKTTTHIAAGNGYQYQAMEVGRCLQAGLLESPLMPWAETLQVLDLMDTVRQSWQLRYPQDDQTS
ncbi:MAG: Gfo/Idh/MocA family oxidoreductase [Leptolyngbya sp. SIOISBB]|nr:Gfo/Idh/MocA family oxidoreductase [Leptolyngbya sp. SIOISBB]